MRKTIKVLTVVVGIAVLATCSFYTKAYFATESQINRIYQVIPQIIAVSADSAQLAEGARLVTARGCRDCHGVDLGGKVFIDDYPLGSFVGTNLTKGKGGLPKDYGVDDFVRALKHGLHRDGTPLLIMPSNEYALLSEKDMGSIVAYLSQLPEVDREFAPQRVGPLARVLTDLGKFPLINSDKIDHDAVLVKDVSVAVTAEFGQYLSTACQGCHRSNMKGGEPIAPGFPVVADISSSGNVGKWTEAEFLNTLRTGKTPEGKNLDPKDMPWNMTTAYTDTELKALYKYLQSI